ncbi:uncharacterized protein Art8 isoform X1 [Plodia interpunctella]|uniref:uncharacterized protein Art8 isoform X1 n=1 Tax=Plodia interpunctella TaxID=58824 RepID=UPI0023680BFA|nr:uncharacterized protein LOC128677481 isoform X1 [Plodia interpunctella]
MESTIQNDYFTSYEDLEVHKLMIEDSPRTEAYKEAISENKDFFKDKVVMDVGCGTGILSIFCAQAGAKKVYAVEASNLANLAKEIIKENKFEDIIEVIHSKVEDVVLPEDTKVDAIVSEWMGFYLLHEGMLNSVLVARDKFLNEGGHIFPESATIYVAPCSLPSLYTQWDDVHGVSMATFAKQLRTSKGNKPEIMTLDEEDILADTVTLCTINLKEDKLESLDKFSSQHVTAAKREGLYQGLCIWFDCVFPNTTGEGAPVKLDTSPNSPPTHWKQAVIVLPEEQEIEEDEPIAFKMEISRDQIHDRRYIIEVDLLDPETTEHPVPCCCRTLKCILIKTYMDGSFFKALMQDDNIEEEPDEND